MTVLVSQKLRIRKLGVVDYLPTWEKMKRFVDARTESTIDEYWVLQHPPVFTLDIQPGTEAVTRMPITHSAPDLLFDSLFHFY